MALKEEKTHFTLKRIPGGKGNSWKDSHTFVSEVGKSGKCFFRMPRGGGGQVDVGNGACTLTSAAKRPETNKAEGTLVSIVYTRNAGNLLTGEEDPIAHKTPLAGGIKHWGGRRPLTGGAHDKRKDLN